MRRRRAAPYAAVLQELVEIRRVIQGLMPVKGKTFGELAEEWLRRIAPRRADGGGNEERHIRHMALLSELREGELTKATIDTAFVELFANGELGAATINKLRSTGRLILRDAIANREWHSANPFDFVDRLREPEAAYRTLALDEVEPVLARLGDEHRGMVKTILVVGMRPGEVFALEKVDVDLKRRVITIRRSHARNQTKTGKVREAPIPDCLVDDLRQAMAESPCKYVFPKPGTSQRRSPNSRLGDRLRTAMKLAGVVSGWRYRCRKSSCPFEEELTRQTHEVVPCPGCGAAMWSVGIPKELRFYDLRHSSATLHREAKCDPLVIQEMLGHTPRNTTDSTYTHLTDAYRLAEVNKLKLG